jgi:hypothetical protein
MAILPVAGVRPKQRQSKGSSGGSGLGALAGAALGAGAAISSGGVSLAATPAILGAAGTGDSLGGLLGGMASPPEAPSQSFQQGAPRLSMVQLSTLSNDIMQSMQALQQMPVEIQQQYTEPLVQGYLNTKLAFQQMDNQSGMGARV